MSGPQAAAPLLASCMVGRIASIGELGGAIAAPTAAVSRYRQVV